jgi:acyl carrier protein phosphodiesterase
VNFLAHLYLSGANENVMIGNFIGDFVKGKAFENYEDEIRMGILLHREIDSFTDSHEIVRESKKRLQPKYRHYSPVIADVFYDHFLSANWDMYSEIPLLEYTEAFYKLTDNYSSTLPQAAQNTLKYMSAGNWLYNYQHIEGIHQALSGMSRRTKFDSKMELASLDLKTDYEDYKAEFVAFFPELVIHSKQFLIGLA